ncbi:peptidase inhibitor family I36 protein [Modestobacter sp. VKM Ac-2983]|uniref:peptidase inhibitor family I36 protein n=1 Tax=Modestobacter sp. VKM Ac-2983 TaxID=3004137 RepID=UPI0022ABAA4D|nr:peptidase inhibitor family I36 protein [Modestobacter sp. VKM Ac-2983]MCZ2803570.1 peptidase inhibitor family I36 protein [Modestobacter sp. VKM Ac-2983]
MVPAGTAAEKSASVQAVAAASVGNCPTVTFGNDWYCFYENSNYGGRRLQWSDSYPYPGVKFQDYGFQYQLSSWVNGGGKYIDVYYLTTPYAEIRTLFTAPPHTSSTSMSANQNDRASGFWTRG